MVDALGENTVTNTMSPETLSWMDEQLRYNTAGPARDHLINKKGMVLAKIGHIEEQECAASRGKPQEKELPYNWEAQAAPWLTLLAGAFSQSHWSVIDHSISVSACDVEPTAKRHELETIT